MHKLNKMVLLVRLWWSRDLGLVDGNEASGRESIGIKWWDSSRKKWNGRFLNTKLRGSNTTSWRNTGQTALIFLLLFLYKTNSFPQFLKKMPAVWYNVNSDKKKYFISSRECFALYRLSCFKLIESIAHLASVA